MNPFEAKVLDQALSQVQSQSDVMALAAMVMKVAAKPGSDAIADRSEEMLLGALINHQMKQGSDRSFSGICKMLESSDLNSTLAQEPDWLEFRRINSDAASKLAIAGLQLRLAEFAAYARHGISG